MENEDLKKIWNSFNKNIENQEKAKEQILKQIISKRSEFKLLIMKYQSLLGVFLPPFILIFLIIPIIKNATITPYFIIGAVFMVFVLLYSFLQAIKYYKLLNLIKPAFEPVIKTQKRILTVKKFMIQLQKKRNIFFPITASAFMLISWDNIHYELPIKITLLLVITIGIYFWGRLKQKLYFNDMIDSIDMEIKELEEYNISE